MKQKSILHDSSSSWSHAAAFSIFSPVTHRRCKCLQHDPQRAFTRARVRVMERPNNEAKSIDDLPETHPEGLLIAAAVCEAGAGGLGLADATAVVTPVDLRFVKAKHRLCSAKK